ncbi:MAG: exodeoxyribonuclease VII small subunit [Firmicutes bacterium]|nr:exodeoxyribonuclease VII small subunit [Bacillota bacterium]
MDKENNKSFEEKLSELEIIVKKLENGDIPLDDAIKEFNNAMELAKDCNKELEEATKTINKVLNKNGEFEDFEIQKD